MASYSGKVRVDLSIKSLEKHEKVPGAVSTYDDKDAEFEIKEENKLNDLTVKEAIRKLVEYIPIG